MLTHFQPQYSTPIPPENIGFLMFSGGGGWKWVNMKILVNPRVWQLPCEIGGFVKDAALENLQVKAY